MKRWASALLVLAWGTAMAHRAAAEPGGKAEMLFYEARQLMAEGKFEQACTKFEESDRLDPGVGTHYNLADCHARIGRLALAWREFGETAARARELGQRERERIARERADAISSKLTRVTVNVSAPDRALTIRLDGTLLDRAVWGRAHVIDQGTHLLVAQAPGRASWESRFAAGQDEVTVAVPELAPLEETAAPAAPAAAPSAAAPRPTASFPAEDPPPAARPGFPHHEVAATLWGVAGVSVGVGSFFLLRALTKHGESKEFCTTDENVCEQAGVALREEARSAGNVATVSFAAAGASLLAGTIVWFIGPRAPATLRAMIGPGVTGIALDGKL